MKKAKQSQLFSEIPCTVLWEILGRVSIRTCLTCKLVCKEWYHIIVSPEFSSFRSHCVASRCIILFPDTSAPGRDKFILVELENAVDIDYSHACCCSLGVDDLIRFKLKFEGFNQRSYVRSHCNGVICFQNKKHDYFVCNLLTGSCVKLEKLPVQGYQVSYVSHCELGCCSVSGQFKVLVLVWDMGTKTQQAYIQILGDGEWKSVGKAPMEIGKGGCFLNGSSHWRDDKCIWSFHFGKEKFSPIPFPDDDDDVIHRAKTLSVFGSCLCLSGFSKGRSDDIWVMKEYGVKESWVKQFVIVNDGWSVPLVPIGKGKILLRGGFEYLYLYDMQAQVCWIVVFKQNGLSDDRLPIVPFDVSFLRF